MQDKAPCPEECLSDDRLRQVCSILAEGLTRLHARKSSELSRRHGESSLDFTAHQSGRGNRLRDWGMP